MARRNFDPDGCNQALLTGPLTLEDNFLYVGDGNIENRHFSVWPRTYSIDESSGVPTVIGSNGEVVIKVGDQARFGGSSIPEGNTFWMENLVSPLPERFDKNQPVWGMCSYSRTDLELD